MSAHRPRVRTWRRTLRALALTGRARDAHLGDIGDRELPTAPLPRRMRCRRSQWGAGPADAAGDGPVLHIGPGPRAVALREDTGPLLPRRLLRPRQGRLGDCWVMAPMLAIHETAPERLRALLTEEADGIVAVQLPAMPSPVRVDRHLPVDARGVFQYGRRDGANPGWVGVLEKAIAVHVAGGYAVLQRGFARFGLELLLGERVHSSLRMPSAAQIIAWRAEGRAICASTHPLSPLLVPTSAGPLPPSHVVAVVGADARTGHVQLRDPVRPADVLVLDARRFRRGFLSVDVTAPLG
ncbi:C2 family cysteine protease [Brachybacterium vulturis]|nr:C2 family cysteine protease [Brachybacterium vulturis]